MESRIKQYLIGKKLSWEETVVKLQVVLKVELKVARIKCHK